MTGKEYLAFMQEGNYKRTQIVRLMEQCVALFEKNGMRKKAEITKWEILEIAEIEKEKGELM
ncbi:hypothetical protein [Tetragenococcus halophilus]|uniref:Uncharacterized protein n=1 Tax=Tetragenococcus halophilus (strain DSM 20338 / JCM 20259 / NCIMB 9735 / NBRC 12172) TaxID=945021 RepID=A0AAN1VSD6_TETHN|nr:hypothetical protein [Tetragenococcus halophilus]BAK95161.1 hypothetical protein TEH_18340 [Tetragenococcus halophilus NBRC 12172]GBD71093.1 putative uncharacterized protein [Tetragenococcus halophilus subsp. halophilus]